MQNFKFFGPKIKFALLLRTQSSADLVRLFLLIRIDNIVRCFIAKGLKTVDHYLYIHVTLNVSEHVQLLLESDQQKLARRIFLKSLCAIPYFFKTT